MASLPLIPALWTFPICLAHIYFPHFYRIYLISKDPEAKNVKGYLRSPRTATAEAISTLKSGRAIAR